MAKTGKPTVRTQVQKGAMGTEPKAGLTPAQREKLRQQFLGDLQKLKTLDPTSPAYATLKSSIEKNGTTLKYKTDAINNYIGRYTKGGATPKPPPAPTPEPGPGSKFPGMTPEQQERTLVGQGGQPFINLVEYGDSFDPNNPYAKYETAFLQARNRAYNDVMAQFERDYGDEFARQNAQFQQRMAEQGIDPASATYQAQYKALADAQSRARQEARGMAINKSYEVQNQAYTQASAAVNQLTEMAKAGLIPWQQVQEARDAMERQKAVIAGEQKRTEIQTTASKDIARALEAKATTAPGPTSVQTSIAGGLLSGAAGTIGARI